MGQYSPGGPEGQRDQAQQDGGQDISDHEAHPRGFALLQITGVRDRVSRCERGRGRHGLWGVRVSMIMPYQVRIS